MITITEIQAHHIKGLQTIALRFPENCSVLIEGANESGKSTLFEAIYFGFFGSALVGEDDQRPKLEDLLTFQEESGYIELRFSNDERSFFVRRELKRNSKNIVTQTKAIVKIYHKQELSETVEGASAVNLRIIQEMHSLDGETMRNSCFVEQKELERLESLAPDTREKAIEKLLGLERLTKISVALDKERIELEKEERLLALRFELAQALAEKKVIEQKQNAVELQRNMAEAKALLETLETENTELIQAILRKDQLTQQTQELKLQEETLKQNSSQLTELRSHIANILAKGAETQTMQQKIDQLTAHSRLIKIQEIPQTQERIALLQSLINAILQKQAAATETETAAQTLSDAENTYQRSLQEKQTALAQAANLQSQLARQEALLQKYEQRKILLEQQTQERRLQDILYDRMRAAATNTAEPSNNPAEIQAQLRLLETQRANIKQTHQLAQRIIIGLVILLTVNFMLYAFTQNIYSLAPAILLAATTATIFLRQRSTQARLNTTEEQLRQKQLEIIRAEERIAAAVSAEQNHALLQRQRQNAIALGMPQQFTEEDAQRKYAELIKKDLPEIAALQYEAETLQQDILRVREEIAGVKAKQQTQQINAAELLDPLRENLLRQAADTARQRTQASKEKLTAAQNAVAQLLQAANILAQEPDIRQIDNEIGSLQQSLLLFDQQLAEDHTTSIDLNTQLNSQTQVFLEDIRAAIQSAAQANLTKNIKIVADETITAANSIALLTTIDEAASEALQKMLTQSETLRNNELTHHDGANDQIIKTQETTIQNLESDIRAIMTRLHKPIPNPLNMQSVCRAWPEITDADTVSAINEYAAAAREALGANRLQIAKLLNDLQISEKEEETLTIATCAAALEAKTKLKQVNAKSQEMIQAARRLIAQEITPVTERNMNTLLPQLTNGRYHHAKLDTEDKSGYKLKVYDQTAGRFVGKAIYSGGARDQCSLALRLAFALATLPQELNTQPGFLFLDEPLSAFDAERGRALVDLLTKGEISTSFAQVFVISHQHNFSGDDFGYHIIMENGQVLESDLPDEYMDDKIKQV